MKNIFLIFFTLFITMMSSVQVYAQMGRYAAHGYGNYHRANYIREEAQRKRKEAIDRNVVIRSIRKADFRQALEYVKASEDHLFDPIITMQEILKVPRNVQDRKGERERLELVDYLLNHLVKKEININGPFVVEKGLLEIRGLSNLILEALHAHHFAIAMMIVNHPQYDVGQDFRDSWTPELLAALNFPPERERDLEIFLFTLLKKGSLFNKSTPTYFKYFSKSLNAILLERGFTILAKKVRNFLVPDQTESCPPSDVGSHLRLVTEVEQVTCAICREELQKGDVAVQRPSGCDCTGLSCVPCMKTYIKMAANESGTKIPTCPFENCRKELEISLLDSVRTGPVEKRRILNGVLEQRLRANPNYKQCRTPSCRKYFSVNPNKKEWVKCPLCEKESFLEGANVVTVSPRDFDTEELEKEGKEIPPVVREEGDIKGLYRRCYFCKVLTCRYDGCNSVSCLNCKREWDFNYGDPKNHPAYREGKPPIHDYERMTQQF